MQQVIVDSIYILMPNDNVTGNSETMIYNPFTTNASGNSRTFPNITPFTTNASGRTSILDVAGASSPSKSFGNW